MSCAQAGTEHTSTNINKLIVAFIFVSRLELLLLYLKLDPLDQRRRLLLRIRVFNDNLQIVSSRLEIRRERDRASHDKSTRVGFINASNWRFRRGVNILPLAEQLRLHHEISRHSFFIRHVEERVGEMEIGIWRETSCSRIRESPASCIHGCCQNNSGNSELFLRQIRHRHKLSSRSDVRRTSIARSNANLIRPGMLHGYVENHLQPVVQRILVITLR